VNLSGETNASPSDTNFVIAGFYTNGDFTLANPSLTQTSSGATATFLFDGNSAQSGSFTLGTFTPGDSIIQAVSGATATYVSYTPSLVAMVMNSITGTPDGVNVWTDESGNSFTPAEIPNRQVIMTAISGSPDTTAWTDGVGNSFTPYYIPYDYSDYLATTLGWTVTTN
jgi:hypothetical protein